MENESIKINKLTGNENWETWKFQVKVIMTAERNNSNSGNAFFGVQSKDIEIS